MAVLHTYRYSLACRHLGPSVDGCVVQADGDFRKAGVRGRHGSDYLVGSDAVSADGCHLLCGSGAVIGNFACTFFGKGKWTFFRKVKCTS